MRVVRSLAHVSFINQPGGARAVVHSEHRAWLNHDRGYADGDRAVWRVLRNDAYMRGGESSIMYNAK